MILINTTTIIPSVMYDFSELEMLSSHNEDNSSLIVVGCVELYYLLLIILALNVQKWGE